MQVSNSNNPAKEETKTKDEAKPQNKIIPEITLPKGGGAIKGIEEKFQANPVTGSASMSIPLPVSPARNGFSPQLSLSYDSNSGNSVFGLGWYLSIPAIRRKTEKQLPQYADDADSDIYILSGAEDLIPFLVDNSGNWEEVVETRTENSEDYTVKRYRPRTEGLFARIERWTRNSDKLIHWKSISKDNITAVYGIDSNACIADPLDEKKIFCWYLQYSFDNKGNFILYTYKHEDAVGVDFSLVHEKNRYDSGNPLYSNTYLKKVEYGNTSPFFYGNSLPDDFLFSAVFDFGEHDETDPQPGDSGDWIKRTDSFSDYKAGFEVRTNRLCKRVLLFHQFSELIKNPCMVRSLDIEYGDNQLEGITFLINAVSKGYKWDDLSSSYTLKEMPPLSFGYQLHDWNFDVKTIAEEDLMHSPYGIDDKLYQFTDLYSEGLSGILSEQSDGWFYKSNEGGGKFSSARLVSPKPSYEGLSNGALQLQDLENNGKKYLVSHQPESPGFFELNPEEEWVPFRLFDSLPNINFSDPAVKYLDINGDGIPDLAIDDDCVYSFFHSKGEKGYEEANRVFKVIDEEKGLNLVFNDQTQSIFLADINGDGLTDIVRIKNGEVCYWANMGYGKFGTKTTMDNSPLLDHPDHFNPAHIRLADLDGSGTTDLIYLGQNEFKFWLNLNGNAFFETPGTFPAYPSIDNYSKVMVTDLLGTGTSCVVWSSPLPGYANRQIQYVDLVNSKKPHVMNSFINNMGKEITLEYTPSTKFYLDAKHAGTPWVTKLPFPVQCLSKVIVEDKVAETRYTNNYIYHHGYYDHEEREFRGFGRVDTFDTEEYDAEISANNQNLDDEFFQPPIVTRTWYHTGAWIQNKKILDQFAHEYFQNPGIEHELPQDALPAGLSLQEEREAYRACKGMVLRQEVYAMDDSAQQDIPYSVVEHNCLVQKLQPVQQNKYACFLVTENEAITYNYERDETDPRIAHTFNFEIDEYGNIEKSAAVVYPRLNTVGGLPAVVQAEQAKLYITCAEINYTNDIDTNTPVPAYRLRLPCENKLYELTGATPSGDFFTIDEIAFAFSTASEIAYQDTPVSGFEKRLVQHSCSLFLKDDLSAALGFNSLESLGIPYESYKLAFTPDLVTDLFDTRVNNTMLTDGGYVHFEGDSNWWIPSGTAIFDANASDHFYLPVGARDPFGNESQITYDAYDLLVTESEDALNNIIFAENDYRTLSPSKTTDPNLNEISVEADELGMVIKTALMSKTGLGEGDTLTDPTVTFEYDLFNYTNNGKPVFAHSSAREQHGASNPRWQESYVYSDGSGKILLTKVQAEPGEALEEDGSGGVTVVNTTPDVRWVGNGRTIRNNKGKPVKQYEPYFSITYEFEDSAHLVERGITPVLKYDSLNRVIKSEFPNGTFSKVEFDAWKQLTWDENDTVINSEWYDLRINGSLSVNPAENEAAVKAADHANTPSVIHLDSLGRIFYTIADNGTAGMYATHVVLDIEGAEKEIIDARDNTVFLYSYDIAGNKCYQDHLDSGERWMLMDVLGKPQFAWDQRDHEFSYIYDTLQRPLQAFVKTASGTPALYDEIVYGEGQSDGGFSDTDLNIRGRIFIHRDTAGQLKNYSYDFKGNLLKSGRQVFTDYTSETDWNASPALEMEEFITESSYDALNRPLQIITPDSSTIKPVFNEANLLNQVLVNVQGTGSDVEYVSNIDYNEKGQRIKILYGNDTLTNNTYDPKTYRVTRILTTANSGADTMQDLNYTYDPVGNITRIKDDAQQTLYFNNAQVAPLGKYTYDALYRLIEAEGREHNGQQTQAEDNWDDAPRVNLAHPGDWTAMQDYTQQYSYDEVGNILELIHSATTGSYTRIFNYSSTDNRLISTEVGVDTFSYAHHAEHGFITGMPHLDAMDYNFKDELQHIQRGTTDTYYVYDAGGNRVRKVTEKQGGIKEQKIYLGVYEVFRKTISGNLDTERQSLHVMDDKKRIAIVDTPTVLPGSSTEVQTIRYQYDNHLGTACLEMDDTAQIITYEEYHPFGTTAYHANNASINCAAKRYKYTNKERDDESGFYYYGARYYASWLCRFISVDPLANKYVHLSPYDYAGNKPISHKDLDGTQGTGDSPPAVIQKKETPQKGINLSTYIVKANELATKYFDPKNYGEEAKRKVAPELNKATTEFMFHSEEGKKLFDFPEYTDEVRKAFYGLVETLWNDMFMTAFMDSKDKSHLSSYNKRIAEAKTDDEKAQIILERNNTERLSYSKFWFATEFAKNFSFIVMAGASTTASSNLRFKNLAGLYTEGRYALALKRLDQFAAARSLGKVGTLTIEEGGKFSASEINAATYLKELGHDVILRTPKGTRAQGGTSDLLVDGVKYDVYTPKTSNPSRIISEMAKKNDQTTGIILDLSQTTVTPAQLANALLRVNNAGATNIKSIIIMSR